MHTSQPAKFIQQTLPNRHCTLALYTHAQKDGDQLSIGESLRAQRSQPLARTVRLVQVHYAINRFGIGVGHGNSLWEGYEPILQRILRNTLLDMPLCLK